MFALLQLTIGHNVRGIPCHDTTAVCRAVEERLGVEAYTAIPCYGMWKSQAEDSTRIEIATTPAEAERLLALVPSLASALDQEAVMATYAGRVDFIEAQAPALALLA